MRKLLLATAISFGLVVAASGSGLAASAGENHAAYMWVVGAVPAGSSDTAMAPDGSTVTLKGHGVLQAGPGSSANGGGTYSMSSGGSGTWTVTGMLGFVSYGSGAAQGLPADFFGGETKLRVHLSNGADGVLTITCELGSPPAGHMEGVTLILGQGGEFTMADGGNTVFVHQ
ncbi:MAG TPA: hypothetical protein VK457_22100 [Chloroflexota bacterium]|nr:hypothetical protein [Chloroflexota bacterium]